jgi:hypothetical protein
MKEENFEETQIEETTSQETTEVEGAGKTEATTEALLPGQQEGETLSDFAKRVADEKADLEEKNKQLYARTKKTEQKVKPVLKSEDNSEGNIELIEFFARGNSREDYQKLQVIMKGTGLSMTEAMADPLYQSYKEKKDREARDEKAQIGASKSSSSGEKSDFKPGMTADEHKEAWKKANSK